MNKLYNFHNSKLFRNKKAQIQLINIYLIFLKDLIREKIVLSKNPKHLNNKILLNFKH